MAVCALFVNGWSVDDCLHYLHVAVFLAFQRHFLLRLFLFFVGGVPFVPSMLEFLVSLVVDSKYSAGQLEMMQRDVYGPERSLTDSHEASRMGAMVAVTLTTTHDTSTFIATNYNGVGKRDPNCGECLLSPFLPPLSFLLFLLSLRRRSGRSNCGRSVEAREALTPLLRRLSGSPSGSPPNAYCSIVGDVSTRPSNYPTPQSPGCQIATTFLSLLRPGIRHAGLAWTWEW
jgi:hypothetical protein